MRGIRGVSPEEEEEEQEVGYGGKDLQKRKVLSLERKGEGVMDDESGESMEPVEKVPEKTWKIIGFNDVAVADYKSPTVCSLSRHHCRSPCVSRMMSLPVAGLNCGTRRNTA